MKRYQFDVAALTFECQIPEGIDVQKFLFSYIPFYRKTLVDNPIFVAKSSELIPDFKSATLLEHFSNDLGDVSVYSNKDLFMFSYSYSRDSEVNYMIANGDFSSICMNIQWNGYFAPVAFTSMIRTAFAQRVLFYEGVSIHSSVIKKDNKGFLFLGKSGTGKSTHTRLWLQNISGTTLLNDDNPICRFIENKLFVFGSPWSGKTPCYINDSAEVVAFVRLEQSLFNDFSTRDGIMAWTEVFPSCSVLKQSDCIYQLLVKTLNRIVMNSIVAHLKCLPNEDAAIICEKSIRQLLENE